MCNCFDNKVGFVETVMKAFGELFIDETKKGIKLQTMEYKKQGSHIIVDQGKNQIAGYTDIKKGLFEDVPVIIFGDHTRVIKYVDQPFFLGADGVKILRSKDKNANYKYLYYALRNANIPDTGYNRHFKWLKETKINYPSVARQDEIVRILDKLSDIIDRRKTQLQGLDSLIKARFVEMFGDENNPQNWNIISVEDVADVQVGVVIKPSQYYTDKGNGVKAFRSLNIGEGFIKDNDWVYFTEEGHKKNSKSIVKENDLLIVRSGAPGTACVVTQKYIGYNAIDIIIVHPDCKKINPYYLCCYTNMPHGKKQINEGIGGAAQQHFNVGKYNKLRLMLPPKELQDEFATFIHQVDKSKLLSLIKLLEQLITYLYNVFIIYRQDKGEEVENHE